MTAKGMQFGPGKVQDWLDCGNKNATVDTNHRVLEFIRDTELVAKSVKQVNSVLIEPCYVGENVVIRNSVVGPHVSIGDGSIIEDSRISDSIVQENTTLKKVNFTNSMIGSFVEYHGESHDVSIGDYSTHGKK
ncbi:MAG: hypothetical protein HKN32_10550 [Flavobacteriales bacterium]|nr:hypothetical protein [Flavobacteriales bacterium]